MIKVLHRKTKLTQAGFAKLLGVSLPTIHRWETGMNFPHHLALEGIAARVMRFLAAKQTKTKKKPAPAKA